MIMIADTKKLIPPQSITHTLEVIIEKVAQLHVQEHTRAKRISDTIEVQHGHTLEMPQVEIQCVFPRKTTKMYVLGY